MSLERIQFRGSLAVLGAMQEFQAMLGAILTLHN